MENTDTSESLLEALSAAEDALSRLDERVRLCAFRLGWAARQDFAEAVAWSWTGGSIVPLHDLILHDENMDVRMPDEALRAAHGVVRARRKAAAGGAELLTPEGAAWLAGRRNRAPSPSRVERAPNAASAGGGAMLDALVQALDRLRSGVTESRDEAVGEWLAERLEVSKTWLSRFLDLAKLPEEVVAAFGDVRLMRENHARELKPLLAEAGPRSRLLAAARTLADRQAQRRLAGEAPLEPAKVVAALRSAALTEEGRGPAAPTATTVRNAAGAALFTVKPKSGGRAVIELVLGSAASNTDFLAAFEQELARLRPAG